MNTLGISQWTSPALGVEKVEEMLSKAINFQKDLWDILVVHSTERDPISEMRQEDLIPPQLVKSLKGKLENSMDSCNSALNRLKDIMAQTTSLPSLASPENLELQKEWNTYVGSFLLNELSHLSSGAQTCDDEEPHEQSMSLLVSEGETQLNRGVSSLPTLELVSDWNMLSEASVSDLPPSPGVALMDQGRQSPSYCQLHVLEASYNDSIASTDLQDPADNPNDGRLMTKLNSRGLRPRCGPKRDREQTEERGANISVVFQELKPGDDMKKGIPDDGHRCWKKYGNKAIQNSNFCRGYYKCSMKECRAKKMVQPTDKNPSIFEVTYLGKHTCSSTSRRRIRSRPTPAISTKTQANSTETGNASQCTYQNPQSQYSLRITKPPGTNEQNTTSVQSKNCKLPKHQHTAAAMSLSTENLREAVVSHREDNNWPSAGLQEAIENEGNMGMDSEGTNCSREDDEDDEQEATFQHQSFRQHHHHQHPQTGFSFHTDTLLWSEILNSNHREVWSSGNLQVEI